jgi:hypothetical protein
MKMQPLVALQKFSYAGKTRRPGDVFQATPRDARILIVLKRAQEDPAGSPRERAGATETAPVALVTEAMGMSGDQPRKRGRPRRASA